MVNNTQTTYLFKRLRTLLACAAIFLLLAGCASPSSSPAAALDTPANTALAVAMETLAPTPTPEPTQDPATKPVTLVWMSDTQGYASSFPDIFSDMTQWIVDHQAELNIQYVLQTGDIVNDMLRDSEWAAATKAFDAFVGKVPLIAIAGNHDIKGVVHDYSRFHELMMRQDYLNYPTFGGEELDGRRRYDLVTIGQDDFIILGVGYSVTGNDTKWLNSILAQYSDRTAILLSHYYLNLDKSAPANDAALIAKVVAANPNVRYVLCGHKHGLKREAQEYDDNGDGIMDRTVEALMVDYQALPNGGAGYLMLMTFDPVLREIRVTSYSPWLDDYNFFADESIETYTIPLNTVSDN